MERVNIDWLRESRVIYLGQTDGVYQPGALDPRRSLLIGELQPDALIALDYGDSMQSPSVAYLIAYKNGGRWMRVASSIEAFIQALGLTAG